MSPKPEQSLQHIAPTHRPSSAQPSADHTHSGTTRLGEAAALQGAGNGQTRPPTLFVIFGAQGDLTKRKLIPALYNLAASRHLPQEFAILGVDGVDMSLEDFRTKIGHRPSTG